MIYWQSLAINCPENSLCAPYGPGFFECSCTDNYHGYKCLREVSSANSFHWIALKHFKLLFLYVRFYKLSFLFLLLLRTSLIPCTWVFCLFYCEQGEFPALQVFGPLGASTVVISFLLWFTQRRNAKSLWGWTAIFKCNDPLSWNWLFWKGNADKKKKKVWGDPRLLLEVVLFYSTPFWGQLPFNWHWRFVFFTVSAILERTSIEHLWLQV